MTTNTVLTLSAGREAFYQDVRASISVVPGVLYHLWHGGTENRRYVLRNLELASLGFDPATDLRIGDFAWEWASEKHAMHSWAVEYCDSPAASA